MLKGQTAVRLFLLGLLVMSILLFFLRPQSRLLLTLFPPADLYEPLIKQSISLKNTNRLDATLLNHKYKGTYFVGVYLKNPPAFDVAIKTGAILRLTLYKNSTVLLDRNYTQWTSRFGVPGKGDAGYILGYYEVPKDVPLNSRVKAVISIESADRDLDKNYGPLEFFIERTVDK